MADDITLNAGTGGDTLGADDIGGVKYQIVKMGLGALDSLTLLDGNSGNKSAGTQRVVLATDQPQLTNALKVDGSAVTQPVSDGGSTLSVDDGGSSLTVDGTVAVSGTVTVDASGSAVPVTDNSGSLTVDNGGTFAVQDSQVVTEDAASAGGEKLFLAGAVRRDTAASSSTTDGDYSTINTDSSGRLWVNASGAAIPVTDNSSTLSVDDGGGNISIDDGGNVISVDWNGAAPPIGAGTEAAALRVTVATDSTGVLSVDDNGGALTVDNGGTFAVQVDGNALISLQLIDDIVYTDDTSTHATGTSKGALFMAAATPTDSAVNANDIGAVAMTTDRKLHVSVQDALPAGTNAIGKLAANSGVDIGDVDILSVTPGTGATNLGKAEDAAHSSGDVGVMALGVRASSPTERSAGPTDGDYEPFATNEVGAMWTTLTPSVNGGLSTAMFSGSDGSSILVATAQAVKASAGALYGYYAYNPEAAVTFVHFYNTAAGSVTVGTTNPLMSFAIPAGSAANLSFPMGVTFSNAGWSVAATTTAGGNTAPATGVSLVVWYK